MSVAQFADAGKMTEAEYRERRAGIRATYGDTTTERTAKFDQELARLYQTSRWTHGELAKEEGKGEKWIERHVRFGHFLANVQLDVSQKSLSEGKFRKYWERTDKTEPNERIRLRAVTRLMEEEATFSKPHKGKPEVAAAIKATSVGTWHKFSTIVTNVRTVVKEATEEDIDAVLKGMVQHGWHNVFCEKKKGVDHYRIIVGGNQKIDLVVLKTELRPILEGLKAEGRKNMATMSPPTVAHLAFELERLLLKLANIAPTKRRTRS